MKRILFLITGFLLSFYLSAQDDFYSSDVVFQGGDENMITVQSTGLHEKKKQAAEMAVKSAFHTLFHTGVEGVRDGKPLVSGNNKYYFDRFFGEGRYMVFVKRQVESGEPEKLPTKQYRSTVTVTIMLNSLVVDLVRNKLMNKPLDKISMEETQEEIALPTIMVVPYKKDLETYKQILANDFDRRAAVGKVQSGFKEKGVTTVDIVGKLDATSRSMEFENSSADSNDKQLLVNSGADVYVVVDLKKDFAAEGNRVSLSMKAYETASGNVLASSVGWTNRFRINSLDQLCVYAVKDQLPSFLKEISKSFASKITTGNSVVLKLSVGDQSSMTMNTAISGKGTLANAVRQWVRKNAQNGRYHIQGIVDESMIFDNIQIPAKDTDGLPMDPSQFGFNIENYISSELQVPCSSKIDGSTIYITIN